LSELNKTSCAEERSCTLLRGFGDAISIENECFTGCEPYCDLPKVRTFLGDADSLGLALFIDAGHRLYGYDGEQVHAIAKADFETAMVYDFAKPGRVLLVSPSALFEVRAEDGKYQLVKLANLDLRDPVTLLAAPGGADVLAFGKAGVYQIRDGAFVQVWSSVEQGTIEAYGGTPPTDVAGWGGILFTTRSGNEVGFHLLQPCPDAVGDTQKR